MNTRGKPRRSGTQKSERSEPADGKNRQVKNDGPDSADLSQPDMVPERIAKLLARAGIASRREVERMIEQGLVTLNGKVLDTPAVNVTMADRIEVNGEPLRGIERTRLWLYYKPAGLVTTNKDPEGRRTVFDSLSADLPRVLSIGRLDINTEGLLLLTNDGGLARELELPSTGWLRRYRVRAHGSIEQPALDQLKDGMAVEGVLYGAIEATLDRTQGSNVWITMGLREGKNREIKNVLGALGLEVNRLIRISYGPFQLGDLEEGGVVEVKGRTLRDQLGPRLIAKSGADFDAPLFNETKPVEEKKKTDPWSRQPKVSATPASKGRDKGSSAGTGKPSGTGKPAGKYAGRPEKTAPARNKHESPSDKRSRNLERLDTKLPEERPKKPMRRNMASNVWMGAGARPVGKKKDAASGQPMAETPARAGKKTGNAGKPGYSEARSKPRSKSDNKGAGSDRSGNADRRR